MYHVITTAGLDQHIPTAPDALDDHLRDQLLDADAPCRSTGPSLGLTATLSAAALAPPATTRWSRPTSTPSTTAWSTTSRWPCTKPAATRPPDPRPPYSRGRCAASPSDPAATLRAVAEDPAPIAPAVQDQQMGVDPAGLRQRRGRPGSGYLGRRPRTATGATSTRPVDGASAGITRCARTYELDVTSEYRRTGPVKEVPGQGFATAKVLAFLDSVRIALQRRIRPDTLPEGRRPLL